MSRFANIIWRVNSANSPIAKSASVKLVMLIYFTSGVCSLIDEVVWVRLLKLTLGNTVYASSIVVSTFMGGLALGALIMSRYCDRVKKPLQLYALLETLITISALSLPFLLRVADNAYIWFYQGFHPGKSVLLIVQISISALILLVPSMLMGSTLPLLGRFVTALEDETGHLVGKLYAFNTLGAAAGCFMAGFVFIRAFGVMGTLYTAAALNLMVAMGGWLLSRNSEINTKALHAETVEKSPESTEVLGVKTADSGFYILVAAFFMSGLISIGYELLWMRSIVHQLQGYTYVFSAVLTVYLLGNVIGAGIGSGLVKSLKRPNVGFAVTLFLLGVCGIFYLPYMIYWTFKIQPAVNYGLELFKSLVPLHPEIFKPFAQCFTLFIIPSIIMGIGFPIALQAWANHMHKVGRTTGTAYGANTIGAVVGGIITGFVLIPLFGLQLSITILGLFGVWIAAFVYIGFAGKGRISPRLVPIMLAVVLSITAMKIPTGLFGIVVASNPKLPENLLLISLEEDVTTTISLYRHLEEDALYLYTSGSRVAGDTFFWRSDQKLLGHFGIMLNKNAKNVLSVGFGSGESMSCMSRHNLERADCVEIAPEMVRFSLKHLNHINLGEQLKDEVNIIYMDAKNYIHLTDIQYDSIVNDSIHPQEFAENASLYTKEYFESARDNISEDGLFISWIPTHNVEANSTMNSIFGTMMEVFPYVTVWYITPSPAQYFLLVGSKNEQYFSPAHMEQELSKEEVGDSLSLININNSMDIMSCYIGDKGDLEKYVTSYTLNSDYHPFIEFSPDRTSASAAAYMSFIENVRSKSVYNHIDWSGMSEVQQSKWKKDFERLYDASTYLCLSNTTTSDIERLKIAMQGLQILPDNPGLLSVAKRAEKNLYETELSLMLNKGNRGSLQRAQKILELHPESIYALMIESAVTQAHGDTEKALDIARDAVAKGPGLSDSHLNLADILFQAGQYGQAVEEYKASLAIKPAQHRAQEILARLLIMDPMSDFYDPVGAVIAAKLSCELTGYKLPDYLDVLSRAYSKAGRPEDARKITDKAIKTMLSIGDRKSAKRLRKILKNL